jgi:hypothetical protein
MYGVLFIIRPFFGPARQQSGVLGISLFRIAQKEIYSVLHPFIPEQTVSIHYSWTSAEKWAFADLPNKSLNQLQSLRCQHDELQAWYRRTNRSSVNPPNRITQPGLMRLLFVIIRWPRVRNWYTTTVDQPANQGGSLHCDGA